MSICRIPLCGVPIRTGHLMCPPHWHAVSEATQKRVYASLSMLKKERSSYALKEYREAVDAAIRESGFTGYITS
jgi:hypothetical protein